MFNNADYADVTVSLGSVKIPAHRFVLCPQSQYFVDALEGDFLEGSTKMLTCPSYREHAYFRMVRYLYTGNYDDDPPGVISIEGKYLSRIALD